jgi:hypothetical protein
MPWLDEFLDEPRADTTVGRADALQDSLDSSEVAAVFAARVAARLARSWAAAEDLLVQLDRCASAIWTRNREDALLTLVRGRDAGLVFRREMRALLDTWWAWEETMPEASAAEQREASEAVQAVGGQAIRAAVEERMAARDLRGGLLDLGCPDEIATRFADDVHDLFHELAAFLSYVDRLAAGPHEPEECRDLLYKLMEPWDPGLVTHGAWHLGYFEDDDRGLYRPGMLGWGLAVMDYLQA